MRADGSKNSIAYFDAEYFASLKKFRVGCDENVSRELFKNRDSSADKSLLLCKEREFNIDDIEEKLSLAQNEFDIRVRSALFNCFLYRKTESPYLYVFLRSWRPSGQHIVHHQRWSWYKKLDGSVLCINNPMLHEYQNLCAGWYLGNNEVDYVQNTSELIVKLADLMSIPHDRIIVYGSSAAGTAAIHISAKIRNSVAVAINPQILPHISKHHRDDYEKNVGISLESLGKRSKTIDIIKNNNNKNIVIVNRLSIGDLDPVKRLSESYGMELNYGLSRKDNLLIWIYEAFGCDHIGGHTSIEYDPMLYAIDALTRMFINDADMPYNLYTLMSEFWRDHYALLVKSNMNLFENSVAIDEETRIKNYSKMRDNPMAHMHVGRAYRDGKGVRKDIKLAIEWMKKAARIDLRWANELADAYVLPSMVGIDVEVLDLCSQLADAGDSGAIERLERIHRDGKGTDKDIGVALRWLREVAYGYVGWTKFDVLWRINAPESLSEMIGILNEFADVGDGEAMGRLGRAYKDGKGVTRDYCISSDWFRKALERNVAWVRNEFFDVLWRIGTPESYLEMISVINPAVEAGDYGAFGRLGRAYRDGKGVERDLVKAENHMRVAAGENIWWAKNELLDILWKIGTPESYAEMVFLATEFADGGDGGAMARLGRAYRDGKGVERDLVKAAEWMKMGADKGIEWAKNELLDILQSIRGHK